MIVYQVPLRKLDDLPLDLLGESVASLYVNAFIASMERVRRK
jgi:hypothetical protein